MLRDATARAGMRRTPDFIAELEHLSKMTDLPSRRERWSNRLAKSVSPIWLARDTTGSVVGLAHAGPARDVYPQLPPLELYTLYTRRFTYGSGLADQLTDAAIGGNTAWLWVFTPNVRAQRFYAKLGFAPTGVQQLDPVTDVMEMQMTRPTQ